MGNRQTVFTIFGNFDIEMPFFVGIFIGNNESVLFDSLGRLKVYFAQCDGCIRCCGAIDQCDRRSVSSNTTWTASNVFVRTRYQTRCGQRKQRQKKERFSHFSFSFSFRGLVNARGNIWMFNWNTVSSSVPS